ncbi:MAG: DUF2460 domain-containing protein [Methylovulum sp.]|nr:DUF2460 domain-containing protein [Methylovulum sp.]
MSDLILPSYPGFTFDRQRNPFFDTRIQKTARGQRELRANFEAYPLWKFTVPIGILDNFEDTEMDWFFGFYLSVGGREQTWLYDCPRHNTCTETLLGTGDGTTAAFQLRIIHPGGFIEPVHNPNLAFCDLYIDGALDAPENHAVSATGMVTFGVAPSDGAVITWSGKYYHRCRFDSDQTAFTEFAVQAFSEEEFAFVGSPVNILDGL